MDESENPKDAASSEEAAVSMKRRMAHLVARAWTDEQFKARFISEPAAVFAEYGLTVPKHKLVVLENTADLTHFILPTTPASIAQLSLGENMMPPCSLTSHCGHAACDICSLCCGDCTCSDVCEICC